jgi:hypothetical protein
MTADDENREAIIRGLKAILDAPGTSGKHVEASSPGTPEGRSLRGRGRPTTTAT